MRSSFQSPKQAVQKMDLFFLEFEMGIVKPNEAVRGDESDGGGLESSRRGIKRDSHTEGLKKKRERVSRA